MAIVVVKMPGHPTKAAAEDTLTLMQADPDYIDGSGKVFKEGSTWTAEASFDKPDAMAAVKDAKKPSKPKKADKPKRKTKKPK